MNGLTIVGLAIVVLGIAYVTYGRYLAKTWGIDPNAKTPAYTKEDGEDYIPTPKGSCVFTSIFINSRGRTCNGANYSSNVWMGSSVIMGTYRWNIFWSSS